MTEVLSTLIMCVGGQNPGQTVIPARTPTPHTRGSWRNAADFLAASLDPGRRRGQGPATKTSLPLVVAAPTLRMTLTRSPRLENQPRCYGGLVVFVGDPPLRPSEFMPTRQKSLYQLVGPLTVRGQ